MRVSSMPINTFGIITLTTNRPIPRPIAFQNAICLDIRRRFYWIPINPIEAVMSFAPPFTEATDKKGDFWSLLKFP